MLFESDTDYLVIYDEEHSTVEDRFLRGEFKSGKDVAALRRFTGLSRRRRSRRR